MHISYSIHKFVVWLCHEEGPTQNQTRNAARCNNRDDLAKRSFIILKVSLSPVAYLEPSRTSLMKLSAKIAYQLFMEKAPS